MNYIAKPYVLTNTDSSAYWLDGIIWMPLATGVLTENRLCLIEQRMHNGSGPPTHYHLQDEGMYVIDGQCTFHAGGQTVQAGPGTFVSIPHHTPHSFTVDGDPSHILNFYTPAGFEMIVTGLATPAANRTIPALDAVPQPPRWMAEELSREYGQVKVLGLPFADIPTEENSQTMPSTINSIPPYGLNTSEAPAYWQNDILWTVLATSEQTGGSYSLLEELCPQNAGPAPHVHAQDEAFYILDGEITFLNGEQVFQAQSGAFVYIPSGNIHSFRVDSNTARLLNFYLPGGFERVITEFGVPATSRTLPPKELPVRTEDTPKIKALLEQIGTHEVAVPDFLRSKNDF